MSNKVNPKTLEVLAILAHNTEGVRLMDFVGKHLNVELASLYDDGFLDRGTRSPALVVAKSIGQNDPEIIYSLNPRGLNYFKEILEYSNKNYPKN